MENSVKNIFEMHTILEEEADLLEDSWRIEKEKRVAILGARSFEIDELCKEQEVLLSSLADYENQKQIQMDTLGLNEHSLSGLISYAKSKNYTKVEELQILCKKYREFAISLKVEVQANQELLVKTNQSIQRLLGGLQDGIKDESGPAYSPLNTPSKNMNTSFLLNANA